MREDLVELVGVYDADGGIRGEVTYVVGHLLGRVSCALCDVTHSPIRRKPAWDAMVARLPIPLRVVHRNETTPQVRSGVAVSGLPAVVGLRRDGDVVTVLGPAALAAVEGSVDAFERALRAVLDPP